MLNTNMLDISQNRLDAAAATEAHLHHHGAGLCDLLAALDDKSIRSTLCDLYGAFGLPIPDVEAIEAALHGIHLHLMNQAPSKLDHVGYARNLPASDMTRWHGARVGELLARFRNAN